MLLFFIIGGIVLLLIIVFLAFLFADSWGFSGSTSEIIEIEIIDDVVGSYIDED